MQSSARQTREHFVFVIGNIFIIVQFANKQGVLSLLDFGGYPKTSQLFEITRSVGLSGLQAMSVRAITNLHQAETS